MHLCSTCTDPEQHVYLHQDHGCRGGQGNMGQEEAQVGTWAAMEKLDFQGTVKTQLAGGHWVYICLPRSDLQFSLTTTPVWMRSSMATPQEHFFFFDVYLFLRETEISWAGLEQTERETQKPKQAPGSELSAQSPTRAPTLRLGHHGLNRLSHSGTPALCWALVPWHGLLWVPLIVEHFLFFLWARWKQVTAVCLILTFVIVFITFLPVKDFVVPGVT